MGTVAWSKGLTDDVSLQLAAQEPGRTASSDTRADPGSALVGVENSVQGGLVPGRPSLGALLRLPTVAQAEALVLFGVVGTALSPLVLPQHVLLVGQVIAPFDFHGCPPLEDNFRLLNLCTGIAILFALITVLLALQLAEVRCGRDVRATRRAVVMGIAMTALLIPLAWLWEGTVLMPSIVITASLVLAIDGLVRGWRYRLSAPREPVVPEPAAHTALARPAPPQYMA